MHLRKRLLLVFLALGVLCGAVFGVFWARKTYATYSLEKVVVEPAPPQETIPDAPEPPDPRLEGLAPRADGAHFLYAPEEGVKLLAASFIDNETLLLASSATKGKETLWRLSRLDLRTRAAVALLEGPAPRTIAHQQAAHRNAGKLCYVEQDPKRKVFEVWCADIDGRNPKQVTKHDGKEDMGAPAISPDGSWIAFEVATDKPKPQGSSIWKIRLNGADLQQLTRGANDRKPTWSDDGASLSFQRRPLEKEAGSSSPNGFGGASWDMYVMDADGKNAMPLLRTHEEHELFPTRRAATGTFVIVESASGAPSRLKTIDAVTKKGEYLTDGAFGEVTAPSVSPDGALVSFIAPAASGRPDALGAWLVQLAP